MVKVTRGGMSKKMVGEGMVNDGGLEKWKLDGKGGGVCKERPWVCLDGKWF